MIYRDLPRLAAGRPMEPLDGRMGNGWLYGEADLAR